MENIEKDKSTMGWIRPGSVKAAKRFCLLNHTSPYLLMNNVLEKFLKKELDNEVQRMKDKHDLRLGII